MASEDLTRPGVELRSSPLTTSTISQDEQLLDNLPLLNRAEAENRVEDLHKV